MIKDFEYEVLDAIVGNRENAYAFVISETISEKRTKRVTLGAIHTSLSRLEEKGFVKSEFKLPKIDSSKSNRPRRYYTITGLGIKAMRSREVEVLDIYGGNLSGVSYHA